MNHGSMLFTMTIPDHARASVGVSPSPGPGLAHWRRRHALVGTLCGAVEATGLMW